MRIALYFTVTKSYIDVAKIFLASFLYFNKEDVYDYHVYITEPDIDLTSLKELLPNMTVHWAKIIALPNTQSIKDGFSTSEHNPLFTSYISALDELLEDNYDLIVHLDLDMLCVGSIYKELVQLTKTEDWQIAGALEQFSYYKAYFKNMVHFDCPYTIEDNKKVNFGFVVFNPKTIHRNHRNLFIAWATQFTTPLYNLDEVFFSWLYQKKIDLTKLVYIEWLVEDKSQAKIIHFAGAAYNKPYRKVDTTKRNEYFLWLPLYHYFAVQSDCSEELIQELMFKMKLCNGKLFEQYRNTGISCYEKHLMKYLNVADVFKQKPQQAIDKPSFNSCVFACVASYDYIDAVYVMLYSLFEYNDVPLVNVYLVNEPEENRTKAEKKLQQISRNIKVISYQFHTENETYLHFSRDYVDCKLAILDELTPFYKYTFMLDSDLLFQGSLKELLPVMYLSQRKIFGAKDICLLEPENIRHNYNCYINGGFIVYKQGTYNFQENYKDWLITTSNSSDLGKFNEQDFINDFYQEEIQYISRTYNYCPFWLTEEYINTPKVIHYLGASKPYLDVEHYEANFINLALRFTYWVKPLTKFYPIYNYYVNKLQSNLSADFVKRCKEITDSKSLRDFHNLLLTSINGA